MNFLRAHLKKIVFVAFVVSIVSAVVTTTILFKNKPRSSPSKTSSILEKLETHTPEDPQKTSFNILLLGYGGGGHSGGGLSDALVLANINTLTKKVNLIAIPRDIWVELPIRSDYKHPSKINAAFAIGNDDAGYPLKEPQYKGEHGGGNMAKAMVELVTGQKIDYYAAIDFGGFERAIDAIGGIDVAVPVSFTDEYYPIKGEEDNLCGKSIEEVEALKVQYSGFELEKQYKCRYEVLSFTQGMTHMDGPTALKFVRSRHSSQHGGDFARGQRQQAVLTATRNKLISLDALNKIDEFFTEFSGIIKSDMEEMDIVEVLSTTGDPLKYEAANINIDTNNYLNNSVSNDGQYILIPKAGIGNWEPLHKFIAESIQ